LLPFLCDPTSADIPDTVPFATFVACRVAARYGVQIRPLVAAPLRADEKVPGVIYWASSWMELEVFLFGSCQMLSWAAVHYWPQWFCTIRFNWISVSMRDDKWQMAVHQIETSLRKEKKNYVGSEALHINLEKRVM